MVMKTPIYLDNHATTALDPGVLDAMMPFLTVHCGNAASNHSFGIAAREAVQRAREQVAALISADPSEIVFTSGATESNNLALKGSAQAEGRTSGHIISIVTEHRAVLDPLAALQRQGFDVTLLPVDSAGLISPEQVAETIRSDTFLVSVMAANNEIGTLQPVGEIGALCRQRGIVLHTDAAQAAGKIPLDVTALNVGLLSFTAHKIHGPRGAGALYVRRRNPRVRLMPQIDGGGHEGGLRSGTLNVPAIVGFGAACAIAGEGMAAEAERLALLRDRLRSRVQQGVPDARVNGASDRRLPNNLNMSFPGIEGEALLIGLHDVAVSSSSACTSGLREPSHVLKALGLGDELAYSTLRFGLGRFNTADEIDWAADRVIETVQSLRALSTPGSPGR